MIRTLVFLVFTVFICCSGCGLNNESSKVITEAEFNVDSSLLNPLPTTDSILNISIGIPRDWELMDDEFRSSLKSSLIISDYKNSELRNGYINRVDSSIMLLIDISGIDNSVFSSLKNNYVEVLNANGMWTDVQLQEFVYKSFRIEQYVLQNTQLLNFKLICYDREVPGAISPKFELLYFLNRKDLANNIKSVESSIGSIEYFTKQDKL